MLAAGDPFTRLLRPGRQATAFQNTTEGQIIALGLQLANAPGNQLQVWPHQMSHMLIATWSLVPVVATSCLCQDYCLYLKKRFQVHITIAQ